jgi:hypothetical protein
MTTQNERLRALLKEAREELYSLGESFTEARDAGCDGSAERYAREAREIHARIDAALAEPGDVHPSNLTDVITLLENERDEARAEVERFKSDSSWCALIRLDDEWRTESSAAYRRGAEAMREAAARFFADQQLYLNAKDIKNLPIPEDKQAREIANGINPCRMFP